MNHPFDRPTLHRRSGLWAALRAWLSGLTGSVPPAVNPADAEVRMARVAHALRGPLHAIVSANEVLAMQGGGGPWAEDARAVIERQVRVMATLLDELQGGTGQERASVPARPLQPAPQSRSVLLVASDPGVLEPLREALAEEGHAVDLARDVDAGLAALLVKRPEVALVAVGLPLPGGLALARSSRAAGYSGRLIALTAAAGPQEMVAAEAARAGFDAQLTLPVDLARLRSLVRQP